MQKNFISTFFLAVFLSQFFLTGCQNSDTAAADTIDSSDDATVDNPANASGVLTINANACIGCGRCATTDPEHFAYDADNLKAEVISTNNLDSSQLQKAIKRCPVDAIQI